MSFFDSKEEVINIELTQYGKYLISKGKFKPKYYAFFDDDVLYDSQYCNFLENQNDSQERILNQTPYMKPHSVFSSVENRINQMNEVIVAGDIKINNNIENGTNLLPYSLGTSDYNSDYLPCWNIDMLSGEIFNHSVNFVSSDNSSYTYSFLKIPQINLKDGVFRLYKSDRYERTIEERTNIFLEMPEDSTFDILYEDINLTNIIQVIEKNSLNNNKNFDIEFFIEDGDSWKPLHFFKDITNIKNNILLDEYVNIEAASAALDDSCVDFYFEVLFDESVSIPDSAKQTLSTIYSSPIDNQFKPFGDDC